MSDPGEGVLGPAEIARRVGQGFYEVLLKPPWYLPGTCNSFAALIFSDTPGLRLPR